MNYRTLYPAKPVFTAAAAILGLSVTFWNSSDAAENKEAPPVFSKAVMEDPQNIATGKEIWQEQCTHCHGSKAYPGKAPKLKPRRYKPSFVFRRVTKGFRKMPAWEDVYDREERIAIVVYIMNRQFSP